jgi:hypothetical protein
MLIGSPAGITHAQLLLATADTDKAAHRAMTNPDGTGEMNGSTKRSPSADNGVTLRESV